MKGTGHYGNMYRIVPFNRTDDGTIETSMIRNIIGYESRKYSCAEINQYESGQRVWPGISVSSDVKILGITAVNMGTMDGVDPGNEYTSTCVDIFGGEIDGDGITIRDCVAVNPYMDGGGAPYPINGPVETQTNNIAYADNTTTKLNLSTFIPASDSALKGAGIADIDLPTDYYSTVRINPPTIGAVEAYKAFLGRLSPQGYKVKLFKVSTT